MSPHGNALYSAQVVALLRYVEEETRVLDLGEPGLYFRRGHGNIVLTLCHHGPRFIVTIAARTPSLAGRQLLQQIQDDLAGEDAGYMIPDQAAVQLLQLLQDGHLYLNQWAPWFR